MKVAVFGAGAIGGHLAGRLARGGADVSVVARGAQLDAIAAKGITVEAPDGRFTARVKASAQPADLGPQDAVIVTVKAPSLPSVAATIAPLLATAATPVIFAMNGIPWWYFHQHGGPMEGRRLPSIDPDDAVWRAVTPARAVGGVVYSACTVTSPGVIFVDGGMGRLVLGEPDGTLAPRTEAVAACLRAGGMGATVTPRIRDELWAKLLMNIGTGPLAILAQAGLRSIAAEPACREACRAVTLEAMAIATALGRSPDFDLEARIAGLGRLAHKPSIVQDLILGRPMEIDALYGVPLALGREAGAKAPLLDVLVGLARVRAREAGLYGT